MNILPHKSWHVRTKQNIARVRRDEERARKEEEERLRRVNLAEHEARIELLRAKRGQAAAGTGSSNGGNSQSATEEPVSFNLFDNFKDKTAKDSEKDVETKVEQEKWEVKAGIFSYLDGRYKHDNEDQWYLKTPAERLASSTLQQDAALIKDERFKQRLDPLHDIKRHLAQMEKLEGQQSSSTSPSNRTTLKSMAEVKVVPHIKEEIVDRQPKRRKHKEKKKSKKRRHKSRRKSSSSSESEDDNDSVKASAKEALVQRLRLERLERERKERLRTQQLLHGPERIAPESGVAPAASKQRYNSQFNPHIARQNQSQ